MVSVILLNVVMMSVFVLIVRNKSFMLSVIMLNVIMASVLMLSVVAPFPAYCNVILQRIGPICMLQRKLSVVKTRVLKFNDALSPSK